MTMQANINFQEVLQESQTKINELNTARKSLKDAKPSSSKRNLVFGVGSVLGVAVIGLFALQIVAGILALALTGVFAIVAYMLVKHFPKLDAVMSMKLQNAALIAQIKEAQTNNIETLKNILLARKDRYKAGVEAHNKMGAHYKDLEKLVKSSCPEDDPYYDQNVQDLERVKMGYEASEQRLLDAKERVNDFEKQINHYEKRAKISKVAAMAMETLQDSAIEDMLSLEAFSAIDIGFEESMTALENEVKFKL
ncbi:hypothetical protein [Vibrio phage RYC]|nr:hypothetical protein [Vibrio phage RYC]